MKLKEECGVFGVSLNIKEAVGITLNGLLSLQHRGQEGAGIATIYSNNIKCHKDTGLVTEIFPRHVESMIQSKTAIGHTSFFAADGKKDNVGPYVREYLTGRIVVANNSCITNVESLKERLTKAGLYFKGKSGGEVIAALIAYHISQEKDLLKGVEKACSNLHGAFSLIIGCGDGRIVAVRDPIGFRPLSLGECSIGVAVSSETNALVTTGFDNISNIQSGEIVLIQDAKIISREVKLVSKNEDDKMHGLCTFEYVYFARPDSTIDGLCVNTARNKMGVALAKESPVKADFVVGVPDSGLEAAIGYSQASGIPMATGFIKNRYVGRSFIYPTQKQREAILKVKLNPLKSNIEGKKLVLVDDSIVRGTTMARIVKLLREAGAKEVHVRISAPPYIHACHYGTKLDDEECLISRRMSTEEIRKQIGADSLAFVSIDGLKNACVGGAKSLCTACFTGYGKKG